MTDVDDEIPLPSPSAMRAYQQRVLAEQGEDPTPRHRIEPEPQRAGEVLDRLDIGRLHALADRAGAETRALPCFDLAEAGRIADAADACAAAGVAKACAYRQGGWCAVKRDGAGRRAAVARLRISRALALEPKLSEFAIAIHPGRDADGARIAPANFERTQAVKLVDSFLVGAQAVGSIPLNGRMLVLAGPTDAGKTFAAICALAQRDGGLFVPAPELEALDGPFDEAVRASFLVLDDVGTEHNGAGGFAVTRIEQLLTRRLNRGAPTIVTTNLDRRATGPKEAPQFAERYGVRLDRRIRDGATFVAVEQRGRT